jgi:hypothetical protein
LVFGGEEVLPLEVQIPSFRVAIQESLTEEESAIIRFAELETLDERRLQVQQCSFILVPERLFPISPNTLSVFVSEMLSPFAESVSRLLEFPERRKSFVSIRERVVRAGLPPCLPATPPNRIKRCKQGIRPSRVSIPSISLAL